YAAARLRSASASLFPGAYRISAHVIAGHGNRGNVSGTACCGDGADRVAEIRVEQREKSPDVSITNCEREPDARLHVEALMKQSKRVRLGVLMMICALATLANAAVEGSFERSVLVSAPV